MTMTKQTIVYKYEHKYRTVNNDFTSTQIQTQNDTFQYMYRHRQQYFYQSRAKPWYKDHSTRAERRCSPDFRAGYLSACHGEPPSVALAAGPLMGPVQAVLSHALSFLWEVPELSRQRRESSDFSLPWLRTKFGERAFMYASPSAWNSLSKDLRAVQGRTGVKKAAGNMQFQGPLLFPPVSLSLIHI